MHELSKYVTVCAAPSELQNPCREKGVLLPSGLPQEDWTLLLSGADPKWTEEAVAAGVLNGPEAVGPYPWVERLTRALATYLRDSLGFSPSDPRQGLMILRSTMETYLAVAGFKGYNGQSMFHSALTFLEREARPSPGGVDRELCWRSLGRPPLRHELEQLPCLLHSAQERARLASTLGRRFLLLGDDDLVSLALPGDVTVVELDPALVNFLRQRGVAVVEHDLFERLPPDLSAGFDVVVTDPPYSNKGFSAFMKAAKLALRPGGMLLLSTNLGMLEEPRPPAFEGFEIARQETAFNRYLHPPELTRSYVVEATRFDVPPELGGLIFGPPLFYSDLWLLRRLD